MNKTEKIALDYLIKQGKTNLTYQRHDSPDFYNKTEGFEIKKLFQKGFTMNWSQFIKLKNSPIPITILVFKDGENEPVMKIPLTRFNNDGKNQKFDDVTAIILPDIPSMKIDVDKKTELEKVAGEIQSQRGGFVSLSDAVGFLINFYRKNKEA